MGCVCNEQEQSVAVDSQPVDLGPARALLEAFDAAKDNLISLLQDVQETYGFLPEQVLTLIARETGIKEAKIYGVATFYSQFRLKPVGKHLIMICKGTACHVNGASRVEQAVRSHLGTEEGEMTADGKFTYISVACLGCCSLSPVMMIDGTTYAKLTPDKVGAILDGYREEGMA